MLRVDEAESINTTLVFDAIFGALCLLDGVWCRGSGNLSVEVNVDCYRSTFAFELLNVKIVDREPR